MPINKEDRARLEQMGEAFVRLKVMTSGFGHPFHSAALEWLAERDDDERSRNEASQTSQMRTALSAERAAWIAAKAAIIAVVATIIGIIIMILTWIFPRPP